MAMHPLKKAMVHITRNPEEHDQGLWICGTVACLAGRIALQAGATEGVGVLRSDIGYIATFEGENQPVKDIARRIAGLTTTEAQHLFSPDIGLDELCHDTVRITMDRAMTCLRTPIRETYHHVWTDNDGEYVVAAHRCTAFFRDHKHEPVIEFTTRDHAYRFASQVADRLRVTYTRHEEPPEVPA